MYINDKLQGMIKPINDNIIEVVGLPLTSNGFTMYLDNDMAVGDYKAYTTLYRTIGEQVYQYSNNGSIYVEPEPIPEPESYIPTLEQVREAKISEISTMCASMINYGVDVEINGEIEHFSYATAEDQANIKELFDGTRITGLPVPYHSDGNGCKQYTSAQFIEIYKACATLKTSQTTYHNQLKEYIKTLTSKDDISSVSYGQELTGIYLRNFNSLMLTASTLMTALINEHAQE